MKSERRTLAVAVVQRAVRRLGHVTGKVEVSSIVLDSLSVARGSSQPASSIEGVSDYHLLRKLGRWLYLFSRINVKRANEAHQWEQYWQVMEDYLHIISAHAGLSCLIIEREDNFSDGESKTLDHILEVIQEKLVRIEKALVRSPHIERARRSKKAQRNPGMFFMGFTFLSQ